MATENPTETDIVDLAEKAARELLKAWPTLKTAQPIERSIAITKALRAKQSGAAILKAVVGGDASFGDLRDGWIQQSGGFGMQVRSIMLSHRLISAVIEGHSAESFVAAARAFAHSRTSKTEWYTPLVGVTVTEAVSLGSNIDLVPWNDVPDSTQKTFFGPESPLHKSAMRMLSLAQMPAIANSAIRVRSAESQVLFSSHKNAMTTTDATASENTTRTVQVQDIMHCITTLSVRTVAVIGNWGQFGVGIANDISGAAYSHYPDLFDIVVRSASSKPAELDGEEIARLFNCYENFQHSDKDVMRVSLDRLSQAIRRQSVVDKAIDLGIALEVMLLHRIGENDRGEMRFRSSIRGATFLGGKKSERLKTFKLLKDAYDLRSRAVHSGVLKKAKKGSPPEKVLEDTAGTCARIARKLIRRGLFPDWDAEYVIGGVK